MSKKTKTTILVIVESPAKCKKIEEYLGPGYKCIATYGHLQTIASLKDIDINNHFRPTYSIINESLKKKQIELLTREIKQSREVVLALDADREGEKIAYCVAQLFHLDIPTTKRITFHEITESAIKYAIQHPRTIDMNMVYAQQARQILDVLVGFKVSPVLWKLIKQGKGENALSAGRCQSPALKLVYENQQEIDASKAIVVYNTIAYFTSLNIPFELNCKIEDEDKMIDFLDKSADFSHMYTCSQPVKILKPPPEPFTTSRLQQVASNELHYSPKETMRICQSLYEGGYITYMRTDSKTYSEEFLVSINEYIINTYSEPYINPTFYNNNNNNNNKSLFAQEAHEAIRPTNISLQYLPDTLDSKEKRMYKLIWTNTLESCMSPASYYSVIAHLSAPENAHYSYTSELIDFPGWKIVENKFSRENQEYQYLQTIQQQTILPYKKICSKVSLKGTKLHYTEARLVQLLEEKGIGRPSTFSSIIDKIVERGYVKKGDVQGKEVLCKDFELEDGEICEIESTRTFGNEKGKLLIQPLGIIVMEFLETHFQPLFQYQYTALMEDALDKIANGELIWFEVCSSCNEEIDQLIDGVSSERKFEYRIDDHHTYMIGKYGPVIKCVHINANGKEDVSFKSVKKDINLVKLKKGEYTLDDVLESNDKKDDNNNIKPTLGQFEGKDLLLRKGKFGLYVTWGEKSRALKEFGNRPIENITFQEVKDILEKSSHSNIIREIDPTTSVRKGPKGDYVYYKTPSMKKPQFLSLKSFTEHDYHTCDLSLLQSWVKTII